MLIILLEILKEFTVQILITDPRGVQNIYDTDQDKLGNNIKFMRGWSLDEIKEYCERKGWKYEVLSPTPYVNYDCC